MRGGAGHSAPLCAAPIRRARGRLEESAVSSRSQAFRIGVRAWSQPFQAESAVRGRSQASLTGVRLESSVSGRSPAGVSRSRPESAWSQLLLARGTPPRSMVAAVLPPPHQHPGTTLPSQIAKSPKEAAPQEEGPGNTHGASALWRPTSRRWELLLANAH